MTQIDRLRSFFPPPAGGRGRGWAATGQEPTPLRLGSKLPSLAAPPACGRGHQINLQTTDSHPKAVIRVGSATT